MKVLFVCSGNSAKGIGTVVMNQAESLLSRGVTIDFFTIKGKGFSGYFKNIFSFRRHLKTNKYDIIHAHYSFSGIIASFSSGIPIIVSLMGSDAYSSFFWRITIRLFSFIRWNITIVKTEAMRKSLRLKKALVIPNGVDMGRFKLISKTEARAILGQNQGGKIIVFVADPGRPEKNFDLAQRAIRLLKREDTEFLTVFNVSHTDIPLYLYSADVLLLTSDWEGSVNVVKEAMACGLPVVSTDVGDVRENLKNVTCSYICERDPRSLAMGIDLALNSNHRTNGRDILYHLKLDSDSVGERICNVYNDAISTRK